VSDLDGLLEANSFEEVASGDPEDRIEPPQAAYRREQLDESGKAAERAVPLSGDVAGIVPVGVLLADASVLALNDEFAVLVFRQPATILDGLLLRFVGRADVAVDFAGP
jgi:hypothetical protein